MAGFSRNTDELAYPPDLFPLSYKSHSLVPLQNDAFVDSEERLKIHLTLHCGNCYQSTTIRGHLPPSCTNYNTVAAISKIAAIGGFIQPCKK